MAVPGPPISGKLFPVPMAHISTHFITTTAALRLSNFLGHHINRRLLLSSSLFQNTSRLGCFHYLRDMWSVEVLHLPGLTSLQLSYNAISSIIVSSYFGRGNEYRNESSDMMKGYSNAPRRVSFNGRNWTNLLLAANVLMFIAQNTSKGRVLYWGAKINSLIDKGQLWRLVTASFLHANIGHLLINCYSLNSVGPAIEKISGPRRFLAIYFTSAIAGCGMSYWLCKAPAVGASGAISGLVGSLAIFTLRHKDMVKGGKQDLQHIMRVIAVNMVMGVVLKGIDNWGHLGGLLGGAAISWLLGPALKLESVPGNGLKVLVDRAPIFTLTRINKTSR